MDATALRASTQAVGTAGATTATGTTNGPSSSQSNTGGGPVSAPTQQVLLGERLLPAPVGEPQTLHLPDGSMLVPVARVDSAGNRTPLTGGAGSAQLQVATLAAAGGGAAAPVTFTPGFEPLGFLYNDRYFAKFHAAGGIDLNDPAAVQERAIKSTFAYLLKEEPEVDDFGVTEVKVRRADPAADADLLHINPRAHLVIDVNGVTGTGQTKSIPSVMNSDGAVFVDPRIRTN